LAEVARVLRPEGQVVVIGLNPWSPWGLRQQLARLRRACGDREYPLYIPQPGEWLGFQRVRDWLRLLGLEVNEVSLGGYRLPVNSARWLARYPWMETVGERSWPVLGAVYCVRATKRVRGVRLVGLARRSTPVPSGAPAAVAGRHSANNNQAPPWSGPTQRTRF
jgi:SAM-dependent methyltransferase